VTTKMTLTVSGRGKEGRIGGCHAECTTDWNMGNSLRLINKSGFAYLTPKLRFPECLHPIFKNGILRKTIFSSDFKRDILHQDLQNDCMLPLVPRYSS